MKILLTALFAICAGSLFAATTHAGPGVFSYHSRDISTDIGAYWYAFLSDGFRYTFVSAQEYYDVKGTYQYGELNIYEETFRATGYGFRSLSCPIERGLVKVLGGAHAASFETAIDLDAAGCVLWGYWYDNASGTTTPDGFSGIIHVLADLTGRNKWTTEDRSVKQMYKDVYVESYMCNVDSGEEFEDVRIEIDGVAVAAESKVYAFARRVSCQASYRNR